MGKKWERLLVQRRKAVAEVVEPIEEVKKAEPKNSSKGREKG